MPAKKKPKVFMSKAAIDQAQKWRREGFDCGQIAEKLQSTGLTKGIVSPSSVSRITKAIVRGGSPKVSQTLELVSNVLTMPHMTDDDRLRLIQGLVR